MNLTEYQNFVSEIRLPSAGFQYVTLGIGGEVGELQGLLAKNVRDGYIEGFRDKVKKELGDILWFVAAIADDFNMDMQDVLDANVEKLSSRRDRGTLQGSGDNR